MPERERPSLAGLAINKKPLLERGKPVVSLDAAESSLLGQQPLSPAPDSAVASAPPPPPPPAAVAAAPAKPAPIAPPALGEQPSIAAAASPSVTQSRPAPAPRPDGHTTIQSTIQSPSRLQPKKKEIRIAWTFKIPHELHQELSAVATYNDLTMSDIVIEAIQLHLPHFPHPERARR